MLAFKPLQMRQKKPAPSDEGSVPAAMLTS
ncbi:hypothetical protein GGE46_004983 [Rhizobium etli]|uniref:Uncharacterized protein n=1 Tax=Rhizobium etli TaxID=29449 RepID=A0A7W6ZMC9_RHIET|nr:hypothetical protein [Rhizobium etli]MBB4538199.1 hypothetical protein [Rhizobium etli]